MSKKRYALILLLSLILLGALALRIYKIGSHDLWFDEVLSSYRAESLTKYTPFDMNPPLYYLIIHFWIKFFGNNEFNLRFLSAIFSTASIFILYKLGKLLLNKKVGLISAFLLAISPIHIWYAQEARGYSLSTFTITAAVYFFILALRKDKLVLWVLFVLSSVVSLYGSYYYLFILPGELLLLLSIKKYRSSIGKWAVCSLFILVSFLPFLKIFFNHFKSVKENFWTDAPTLNSIFISFENFNVGYNASSTVYFVSSFFFLGLLIGGIVYCLRNCKENLIIFASFLLLPIAVIFAVSQWIPIYIDRQLMLYSPFYYFVIATGIAALKQYPVAKTTVFLIVFGLSALSLVNYYSDFMPAPLAHRVGNYIKKPFKPAVSYLKKNYREKDIIIHSHPFTTVTFEYYWKADASGNSHYPDASSYFLIISEKNKYWTKETRNHFKRNPPKAERIFKFIKDIQYGRLGRVWLISCGLERKGEIDENTLEVEELLRKNYVIVEGKEFDGIFVTLYLPRINSRKEEK